MREKNIGILIITLFVGVLIGGALGQLLGLFLPENHLVTKALVEPLMTYVAGPWDLNLIIIILSFGFKMHINFFSILGIVGAWYYYKYSY
ncbi:MAG: DUF4321 domain-containing protein [Candidatus Latescibacteria bacterium]|nr:DUF4321 domain-containing protein [Candidatus Latescibacterota bacterium]